VDPEQPTPEPVALAQGEAGEAATVLGRDAPAADPWLGRVLDGRYRISERLGEGGMGAVFVAEHLSLHKAVALKVIRAELAGNGEVAARFAREAMATAQFEHPHVASAIDYGTLEEGGAYLVMQLVRGRSLRDMLDAVGQIAWPRACELMAQVADALSAARAAGIVHRDLKPENILVETREDGSELVKILDFGIAHVAPRKTAAAPEAAAPTRELTRVGTVMGTPGYMAPEQAVGDRIDHRTDLYALGVVLWECISGKCLWDGADVTTIIARQMREDVPLLRTTLADPSLPRELDALVQSLCARPADARPENAATVRDELRAIVHRHAASTSSLGRALLHTLQRGVLRFGQLPARERGLVIAVCGVLVLGVFAFGSSRSPADGAASLFDRALSAATGAATAAPAPPKEPSIPTELEPEVKSMLEGGKAADRRKAAQNILAYKDPAKVPPHLVAIAKLESARGCKDRKEAIRAISELGDPRCRDVLERMADQSRSGCGFLNLEDCYGCVRSDLRHAIDALQAKATPATTATPK
jgi:serine/threonine-protein kinase